MHLTRLTYKKKLTCYNNIILPIICVKNFKSNITSYVSNLTSYVVSGTLILRHVLTSNCFTAI